MPDKRRQHAHRAEDHIGDLLDADAAQLGRFRVAAHRVDMPAEHGLRGDKMIDRHHHQHDDHRPGQAVVAGQHPGDQANDQPR